MEKDPEATGYLCMSFGNGASAKGFCCIALGDGAVAEGKFTVTLGEQLTLNNATPDSIHGAIVKLIERKQFYKCMFPRDKRRHVGDTIQQVIDILVEELNKRFVQ